MQVPEIRLGPKDLGNPEEQTARIARLQEEVREAREEEREIICIDESVFTSKSGKRQQWAPVGRPLEWDDKWFSHKHNNYIAVCGAASETRGFFHYHLSEKKAFNAKTFLAFLRSLHTRCKKTSMAILMDNASIHNED